MATLLRRCYCHRYFVFNKRHCSGGNGDQFDKLRGILSKLKHANKDSPTSPQRQQSQTRPVVDAQKIAQQRKQRHFEQKKMEYTHQHIQKPLPIPDRIDTPPQHIFEMQQEMDKLIQKEQQTVTDTKDFDQELKLESQMEPKIEKELEPDLDLELEIGRKIHQVKSEKPYEPSPKSQGQPGMGRYADFQSERSQQKSANKVKYEQMANEVKDAMKPKEAVSDIEFNIELECDVSKWIYEQILECDGSALPTPTDIVIQFPLISLNNAREIRDGLVDKLINCSMPRSAEDDGLYDGDAGCDDGATSGVLFDTIQEIDSDCGKFKCLYGGEGDMNYLLDLKRKLNKVNGMRKVVTFGLTNIPNNIEWEEYDCVESIFHLLDDMMHLDKPLIISNSHNILNNIEIAMYLSCGVRLTHEHCQFIFDNCLYGQIPFGGIFYNNCVKRNRIANNLLLWHIFSHEPISHNNAYKLGMIDWTMPFTSFANNIGFFNHFGIEIDKTFNCTFKHQDEYRHRAIIKSIIELFDEGINECQNNSINNDLNEYAFTNYIFNENSTNGIKNVIHKIQQMSHGQFDFQMFDDINDNKIKNIIQKTNIAQDNINRSSPLALYLSYILYCESINEFENNTNNGTEFFRNLLKYEYNALCWLMYFGDFYEGIKYKNDHNYKPKWKWSNMDTLLTSKDINYLIAKDSASILKNSIIFNELPQSDMKSLQFKEREKLDHCVTWKLEQEKRNSSQYYLHDYAMLRGSVPPDIQFKLNTLYGDQRRKSKSYAY